MTKSELKVEKNGFIFINKKIKLIPQIIFIVFILIAFVIPIFATVLSINSEDGIKFGIVITYILLWGSGVYLTRLMLWNIYGREVFNIEQGKLKYYADYNFFKDNTKEIGLNEGNYFLKSSKLYGEVFYNFHVLSDSTSIQSTIKLQEEDSDQLKIELNNKWGIDVVAND